MKIGIAGYQSCGKSSLFEWLSGAPSDPSRVHQGHSAMVPVPDPRIEPMRAIYQPKKLTFASLELVDTPGLTRAQDEDAARLALLRSAGCLVVVVGAYDGSDPRGTLKTFAEELALADLEIVSGRIDRLKEGLNKPRPTREQDMAQLEALHPILAGLESGVPASRLEMSAEQQAATRSFGLLTEKPQFVVINAADDVQDAGQIAAQLADDLDTYAGAVAVPIGLQLELERMEPGERDEMIAELGLATADRDALIAQILDVSRQMLFFTVSEKELRTWLVPQGATAVEAAGAIHSDLARGFIRAEVFKCDDVIRLGSERELKAQHLIRQEPKDYVVQRGEVVHIKFSV